MSFSSRQRQRGDSKASIIFYLLILAVVGLFAKGWIPAKISDMQLKDHMEEMAQSQNFARAESKDFEDEIIRRAGELDIKLTSKDIEVNKTAQRVRMKVAYTKIIDMLFTEIEWKFDHDLERDIFLI